MFIKSYPAHSAQNRTKQINGLIKQELGRILLKETELPRNAIITIVDVKTSPNRMSSKIYIAVVPDLRAGEIMKKLNQQIYSIQQSLNKRLKIRPVPRIIFINALE